MNSKSVPPRRPRARGTMLALLLAAALSGCVYYPNPYGYNGYYSGYYAAPSVVVAPAPVVVGGWWGGGWGWGWHGGGWGGGWHGGCCWRGGGHWH